jgi:hypothetical protein
MKLYKKICQTKIIGDQITLGKKIKGDKNVKNLQLKKLSKIK